jgi:hypothetical protein
LHLLGSIENRTSSKGLAAIIWKAASPLLFYISYFNKYFSQQRDSLAKKYSWPSFEIASPLPMYVSFLLYSFQGRETPG